MNAVLDPAGPQAAHIAELWWVTLAVCAFVFAAVLAVLAWGLWRAPRGDPHTPPAARPTPGAEKHPIRGLTAGPAASTIWLRGLLGARAGRPRGSGRAWWRGKG